ncbi:MAG: DNA repair protein RecO [Kiritimatiellae bacterium]|nr:DNA repair protein RecO [Kiritimatiellia bacterium]
MIIHTEATALQIRPWSQTSHMVTWLTPEYGRIVTAIKGACRPKSAFLGQYDLFYTCDLLFYRRERDGVHAIRECSPSALRESLRRCWRSAAAAAYLADLTARVTVSHQEAAAVYNLLNRTLDTLPRVPLHDLKALILRYEVNLLAKLGLSPNLDLCPHCHTPDRQWLRFSLPSGRFACPHLAGASSGESAVALHRDVRQLFLNMLDRLPDTADGVISPHSGTDKNHHPPHLLLGLSRFLGMFITFHLEVPSAVRRVAFELLDKNPARETVPLETSSP